MFKPAVVFALLLGLAASLVACDGDTKDTGENAENAEGA